MENNLLESRLNKILADQKFSSKNKSLGSYINKETGVFISDYFLVLEIEELSAENVEQKKEELKEKSMLDHIDRDDNTVQYVAVYLWVFNLTAGQFMETDQNKIAFRIPLNLQTHNILKGSDLQTQSAEITKANLNNVLCLSKKNGEQSLQIINSNIDEYQIAIYTEKQIFVGHIESLLSQKYSPSILSIKFHKLSPHHLAVLLDDQYFMVYNLQSSLTYQEIQYNLSKLPRFGRNEEYNLVEKNDIKFIDFEFGGNGDFSIQSQIKTDQQPVTDFDFLSVYFLTEEGHIYYQSPFLIKDMRINRDLLEQLKSYLISELTLVEQHEQIEAKIQILKQYLDLVELIENGDMIKECEQPTRLTKSFAIGQNNSHFTEVPILNTISLQELEKLNFKVQLNYVPTEKSEEDDEGENSYQNSHLNTQFKSSMISQKQGNNVFSKSVLDRVLSRNKAQITHRRYCNFHKVETNGQLHVFILTKQIGNKSYSTVSSRFSPLPVMPTNIIQDYYQFRLIKGEKAHLECPLVTQINYVTNQKRKDLYQMKQNSCAKLCSKSIQTSTLDSVCFSLMNRIVCINFRWIQNLIKTNLSDPRIFNDEKSSKSELRVLVDSKKIESSDNVDAIKMTDLSFYSLVEKDRLLLAIIPSEQQAFRLKSFTLEYLSNYIQIQQSAKLISETLHKLVKAQVDADLPGINGNKLDGAKLSQNKVEIKDGDQNKQADLLEFEQRIADYIKEHEKILKENVQMIKDRYSEVLKKKQQLEEKKKETEQKIHNIIENKEKELTESKHRILQRNESIQKKIQEIAIYLKNPKIEKQIGVIDGVNVTLSDSYSHQTKEYYERLKSIQEQYENYFKKRREFFDTLGNITNNKLQLDQDTVDRIFETSQKVKKHIQIIDNQLSQNTKSKDEDSLSLHE